jgi:hypothetical protein
MRRVYAVWALKKLTSPFAMKIFILAGILKQSFAMVSVPNVIKNSPSFSNPIASSEFLSRAFLNTETSVQLLFIAVLALSFWLIRDMMSKPLALNCQNLRKA